MLSSLPHHMDFFNGSVPLLDRARQVFQHQLEHTGVFMQYVRLIGHSGQFTRWEDLPFLPISFFRTHRVLGRNMETALRFESSGTTGTESSVHHVADPGIYRRSILEGFQHIYGPADAWSFFALLPSYLDRPGASLVHMVKELSAASADPKRSCFYRFSYEELLNDLRSEDIPGRRMLIGVSFALWEMAEQPGIQDLSDTVVVETGGMKGRRREIVREELHHILTKAFHVPSIHSEYGMTELLSQAWSTGEGRYRCPHWMKVLVRDPYDPFSVAQSGKGALNIIDLSNLHSCSFIATDDLGEVYEDGTFTVSGRLDQGQLRGCNLMF